MNTPTAPICIMLDELNEGVISMESYNDKGDEIALGFADHLAERYDLRIVILTSMSEIIHKGQQ